ncbi:hypothetical protein FUA23_02035 [Neolewinella aurantiaca]|uniref:Uncharacterized protein n=1 Tax=Neolewinella aurantiaca TaxID=2602767 RepID=A0A5C7FXJ0_9BACT|nr:hypothetical protein [Neolewinella aurantiaca]TXF91498.1 hypothetical protein FUA23_02035 [Neolewinella aurantiaca]
MRHLIFLVFICLVSSCGDTSGTRIRVQNELDNELRDLTWSYNSGVEKGEENRLRPGKKTRYQRFDGADECNFQLEAQLVGTGGITGGFQNCVQPAPIPEGKWTLRISRSASGTSEFFTELIED